MACLTRIVIVENHRIHSASFKASYHCECEALNELLELSKMYSEEFYSEHVVESGS